MFASAALRTLTATAGALIFAGTCLFGATAPAVAAEPLPTVRVPYTDLNLASDHGRSVLDARIRHAARSVCDTGARDVRSQAEEVRCYRQAIESVQPSKLAVGIDYKG